MTTLADYAHKDIDQMNGNQLVEFGTAVGVAAIEIMNNEADRTIEKYKLVTMLETGMQGASEICFGLMVAEDLGLLEKERRGPITFMKVGKITDEQQS